MQEGGAGPQPGHQAGPKSPAIWIRFNGLIVNYIKKKRINIFVIIGIIKYLALKYYCNY